MAPITQLKPPRERLSPGNVVRSLLQTTFKLREQTTPELARFQY